MKLTLKVLFYWISFAGTWSQVRASDVLPAARDEVAVEALSRFREYFNAHDSSGILGWTVPQGQYDQLLVELQLKQANCLTAFDLTYSTRLVVDEFNKAWQAIPEYRLDSIAPVKVSVLDGCGGVTYKKIDARAYFRKGEAPYVELPLSLILMADGKGGYQLMMHIVNYKLLQNGQ